MKGRALDDPRRRTGANAHAEGEDGKPDLVRVREWGGTVVLDSVGPCFAIDQSVDRASTRCSSIRTRWRDSVVMGGAERSVTVGKQLSPDLRSRGATIRRAGVTQGPGGGDGDELACRLGREARVRAPPPDWMLRAPTRQRRTRSRRVTATKAFAIAEYSALYLHDHVRRSHTRLRGALYRGRAARRRAGLQNRHFASDVAAGALLGATTSYLIYRYQDAARRAIERTTGR